MNEHDSGHQRAGVESVQTVACDDAVDDNDESAGGPADLGALIRREPKSRSPRRSRCTRPACGVTPEEMANAIASGRATSPTVMPATRSDNNVRAL